MHDTTSIFNLMNSISELEKACASLYAFYAEVFEDNKEAAAVFRELKREEENHQNEVAMHRRIVQKTPGASGIEAPEPLQIKSVIAEVEQHIQDGIFDVADAVSFALHLEESAAEIHYRTTVAALCPGLSSLATLLKRGDEAHLQKLKALRELV